MGWYEEVVGGRSLDMVGFTFFLFLFLFFGGGVVRIKEGRESIKKGVIFVYGRG